PQLALSARIHVAHPADHAMRLVIQVEAVGNQLVQLDFRRAVEAPALTVAAAFVTASLPIISAGTSSAFSRTAALSYAFSRRPALAGLYFLLLCHPLNLAQQPRPLQGHQTRGAQLHLGRAATNDFANQVRFLLLQFAILGAAQYQIETPVKAPDFF